MEPPLPNAKFVIANADTVMSRSSESLAAEVFPGVPVTKELGEAAAGPVRPALAHSPGAIARQTSSSCAVVPGGTSSSARTTRAARAGSNSATNHARHTPASSSTTMP